MEHLELAHSLALKAYSKGEVPVGAVIIKNNKVVAKCYNKREKNQIATHHAEILAIQKACKKLKSWRLDNCDMYVTLEPCPMCAGAIINARIKNLYYAAIDETNGGISRFKILDKTLNHTTNYQHIAEHQEKNKLLIQKFFKEKRKNHISK
ncbi:MAG: nucleoside deaminase [Clostridia bacterium]|nr:nucleoside deaminase [Clostridia bacterium]